MAMSAGSVSVDSSENVTGTGLARDLYDADAASMVAAGMLPTVPTLGSTAAPYTAEQPVTSAEVGAFRAARVRLLQEAARRATAYASALVSYIQANAKARVTSQSLGRTPDPNDPDAPIEPPTSPVDLPIF